MTNDPVEKLADVLSSLDSFTDSRRKPNIWALAERVRWLQMAITSTRLDVQRNRGDLDVLEKRFERLARHVHRGEADLDEVPVGGPEEI